MTEEWEGLEEEKLVGCQRVPLPPQPETNVEHSCHIKFRFKCLWQSKLVCVCVGGTVLGSQRTQLEENDRSVISLELSPLLVCDNPLPTRRS